MNILQISDCKVFPPTNGGQERAEGLLSNFNPTDQIIRYSIGGDIMKSLLPNNYEINITSDDYIEFVDFRLLDLLSKTPFVFDYPKGMLLNRLYSRRVPKNLNKLISWAELIIVKGPWVVGPISEISECPVYYSSHNVETRRFKNLRNNIFGEYSYNEVERIAESTINKSFGIICTTANEKKYYSNNFSKNNLILAPNGTNKNVSKYKNKENTHSIKDKYNVKNKFVGLFIGSDYEPNINACSRIIKMCEKYLDQSIHIFAVGSVGDKISDTPDNFETTGFVDDLDPYLAMADFALNPIKEGAGSNTKVFDYFAKGIPTISTEFGLRGIQSENISGNIALEAEDSKSMAKMIHKLKDDQRLYRELSKNCNKYAHDYTWKKISENLRRKLESQIKSEYDRH